MNAREAIALVKVLHAVRAAAAQARAADADTADPLRVYLEAQPEGEREVWDMEADPPIGVALKDGGGARWIDFSELDDPTIVQLARRGGLALNATGYDALLTLASSDRSLGPTMLRGSKAVHEGGGTRLVLLPERGGRKAKVKK